MQSPYGPLADISGDEIRSYFLEDKYFNGQYDFPYNINPLSFLDYDIDAIYQNIRRFGWKKPEEVDANSTNCLLNSYANYIHKQRLAYHPYAFELANLVRSGYMDRETALKRLSQEEAPSTIDQVRKKIENG